MTIADPRTLAILCVPSCGPLHHLTEALLSDLRLDGWAICRLHGLSHIGRARSALAARALAHPSAYRYLLWIDSDMVFEPASVAALVTAADGVGAELVGGVYSGKDPAGGKFCCDFERPEGVTLGAGGGLHPVRHMAFGFCCVARRAFELVARVVPRVRFGLDAGGEPVWGSAWFADLVVGEDYFGEDYSFCERLRSAGGLLLADTRLRLWHTGEYGYTWEDVGWRIEPAPSIHLAPRPRGAPADQPIRPANRAARRAARRDARKRRNNLTS
jgi:hypothetical protein